MLINLYLTHNCNLRCTYCYTGEKKPSSISPEISKKSIDYIIKQARICSADYANIVISGGEPLLNFDVIKEIVPYTKKKANTVGLPVYFTMTTNGLLLTESIIDYFKTHSFSISLSMDGPASVHDLNRKQINGQGSFSLVEPWIQPLLDWDKRVMARLTFTPHTVEHLYHSVSFLIEKGFSEIKIVPDYFRDDWKKDHLRECELQFIKILALLEQTTRKIKIAPLEDKMVLKKVSPCVAGRVSNQFSIAADGSIYPCSYTVSNQRFSIGNVETGIDSRKINAIYAEVNESKRKSCCGSCSLYSYCESGRCTFINFRLSGDMNITSPFFCQYQQLLIKTADSLKKIHPEYKLKISSYVASIIQNNNEV